MRRKSDGAEVSLGNGDAIDDHLQAEADAARDIAACFDAVSKSVGPVRANELFREFLAPIKLPRGRPRGAEWSAFDRELFFRSRMAPRGEKRRVAIEIGEQYGDTEETTLQHLKRLRREWKTLGEAAQQWLIEDWNEPEPDIRSKGSRAFDGSNIR